MSMREQVIESLETVLVPGVMRSLVKMNLVRNVLNALGGLPQESRHCALLAANTIKEAVKDYLASKNEPWKRAYERH